MQCFAANLLRQPSTSLRTQCRPRIVYFFVLGIDLLKDLYFISIIDDLYDIKFYTVVSKGFHPLFFLYTLHAT